MSGTDDRRYWQRHAGRYDRISRLLIGRPESRMLELVVEAVRGKEQVLEVAAGTGLVTLAIAPVVGHLVATDYTPAMVEQFAAKVREAGLDNVECEQADVTALRFEDAGFDAVVAANLLHVVPDLDGALASLRRVLRPDGVLVAPTYLHAETFGAAVLSRLFALTGFPNVRRLSAETLHAAIEGAGFRILERETLAGAFPVGHVVAVPV